MHRRRFIQLALGAAACAALPALPVAAEETPFEWCKRKDLFYPHHAKQYRSCLYWTDMFDGTVHLAGLPIGGRQSWLGHMTFNLSETEIHRHIDGMETLLRSERDWSAA
jgi:hypothetical protein